MAKAEGLKLEFLSEDHIRTDIMETFPYQGPRQKISYVTKEFSAVCPFSGLPDIATVEVTYIPNHLCVELKSLKYYFVSFRNVGIYQEPATARIYNDILKLLAPEFLEIKMIYATRGGIDATTVINNQK